MIAQALIEHIFARSGQLSEMGYDWHLSVGLITPTLNEALDKAIEDSNEEFFEESWGQPAVKSSSRVDLAIGERRMTIFVDAFLTNRDDIDVHVNFTLDRSGKLIQISAGKYGG